MSAIGITTAVRPLEILKEHIIALDAAMLVAVTSTEVGAVHKLRTTTRRVQAHLTLLDLLACGDHPLPLPPHSAETAAVLRRLQRVRRAAGAVRDLDVQTSMVQLDAPLKAAVHKGSAGDTIRKQAKKLRRALDAKRELEALRLVRVLKAEERQLAGELRALEEAVEVVKLRGLRSTVLIARVDAHFADQLKPALHIPKKQKPDLPRTIEALHEDDLHTVRKLAKLCRYMLEDTPNGSKARAKAETFESLQEAGGHWHDWLLLHQLAEEFHGRKAELTVRYGRHAEAALADYRLRLNELLPKLAPM